MGQKINPQSLRLGIVKDWSARWFFSSLSEGKDKNILSRKKIYTKLLEEDEIIRKVVRERVSLSGIAAILIERRQGDLKVSIKTARPGLVIGRGGKGIEELSDAIVKSLRSLRGETWKTHVSVNVEELKRSEVSANYVAQQIAWDIEKRLPFRRAMKKQIDQMAQNREVKGAKIVMAGRLGGGEIARREALRYGALPLQTLRADIDYGTATARTTYGAIGIKVWVYRGEKLEKINEKQDNSGDRR